MPRRAYFTAAAAATLLSSLAAGKTVPISNATITTRACQPPHDTYPFCNTSFSIDERVSNLISLLQPSEIPPQLTARHNGGGSPGPESNISRLGIPTYDWGLNCLHGVQSSCVQAADGAVVCPTSFPNPCNYGMTFNDSLARDLGRIIATETRALWLAGATEESEWSGRPVIGLDVWSPNINLAREPRWGRNQEVPSEDPLVNGNFGAAYTAGVQLGEDARYLKTAVTLKHAFAYSLEDSDGFTRHNFDARVSNATLADVYFPAFKAAVLNAESPARGIMCSYNAVNGQPSCANDFFRQVVREQWGYTGYITSDTGAVEDIYQQHKYVATEAAAACASIANGTTDVCSGAVYHNSLMQAVGDGLCSIDAVTAALRRTLTLRFQLGLFDPIEDQPYWAVGLDQVATPEARAANELATRSSMVLLKNDGGLLPLKPGRKIAVIGPHALAKDALVGNYLGQLCDDDTSACIQTPLDAIAAANVGGTTATSPGCPLTKNDTSGFAAALALAAASDYVVLLFGIDGSVEGESHDRTSIDLPAVQRALGQAVAALGVPTAVVLLNGGMVDVAEDLASPGLGAFLEAGYPGVLGAAAIADTLFGANDHCCGKLPYTMYPASYVDAIPMSEMEWNIAPGRSYRYYAGAPTLPFGFGLALTTFTIVNVSDGTAGAAVSVAASGPRMLQLRAADALLPPAQQPQAQVKLRVTNTGAVTGDEVVFLYLWPQQLDEDSAIVATAGSGGSSSTAAVAAVPLIKQLLAYERVHLAAGASVDVVFNVTAAQIALVQRPSGDRAVAPGAYRLQATNGVGAGLAFPLRVEGSTVVVTEPFPRWG